MRFQLSVFYEDSLFLYAITTADKKTFLFQLKSAPPAKKAPETFSVLHPEKDVWTFDRALNEDFQNGVVNVLKRTKL